MPKGKITGISHIGITVLDAEKAVRNWENAFGVEGKVVDGPDPALKKMGIVHMGPVKIFLNEYKDQAANIQKVTPPVVFTNKKVVTEKGEGISHIAFDVTDLSSLVESVKEAGMRTKWEKPKKISEIGGICIYMEPEDFGLELEFVQAIDTETPIWK